MPLKARLLRPLATILSMKINILFYIIISILSSSDMLSQIRNNKPSVELIAFAKELDDLNWKADPDRLKKVSGYNELKHENLKFFDDIPFYIIEFNDARLNSKLFKSRFAERDGFKFDVFKKAKSIWGYFYRGKKKGAIISDGVIEQWEFEDTETAKKAIEMMKKSGFEIYFNTNPYFFRLKNKLYIFQTRAMMFSLDDQIKVYRLFINKNSS